jgi:hypothetical protein
MTRVVPGRRFGAGPVGRLMRDRGSVILETAIAIPALVAVAAALVWALGIAGASLAVQDATRHAARELARGASEADVRTVLAQWQPDAEVGIERQGDFVVVTIRRDVAVPAGLLSGLSVPVQQSARVVVEW